MKTVMASMGSLGLALFAVTGCVSQSRYDRLATEYSSELQARRQLEDELGRHQGQLGDLNAQLREKDEAYSSLSASAQNDKSRIAELQKALDEAQKSFPVDDGSDGVEVFRTDSGFGYRIADALLFDPGSSDLRESGKKALVTIAREITEKGYRNIRIDGHTDSDPVVRTRAKYPLGNHELAIERALAVFSVLTKDGKVPESSFTLVGFGPNSPMGAGTSDAAKAKNRRVEIHVAVPKKS